MESSRIIILILFFTQAEPSSINCHSPPSYCTQNTTDWKTEVKESWETLINPATQSILEQIRTSLDNALKTVTELKKGCIPGSGLHDLENLTLSTESSLGSLLEWHPVWDLMLSPEVQSENCRESVVKLVRCGHCGSVCPCALTLQACLALPSATLTEAWKHALDAVRTGLRLIKSQLNTECTKTNNIEHIASSLNTWREPFSFFSRAPCEVRGLEGGSGGQDCPKDNSQAMYPQLEEFKDLLANVTKRLQRYWPQVPSPNLSPEELQSDEGTDYLEDSEEYEGGSGSGGFPSNFHGITDDEEILEHNYESSGGEEEESPSITREEFDFDLKSSSTVQPILNTSNLNRFNYFFLLGATIALFIQ